MRLMRRLSVCLIGALLGGGALLPTAWASERAFAVISAPGTTEHERHLARETVALMFRRKQNFWDNGVRVQAVNLPAAHPLRRAFSVAILGQAPEDMEDYWREMYFNGVLPPHVLASEEAVILFVSSTPGAIGYVSACLPEHGVNVVLMVGDVPFCNK